MRTVEVTLHLSGDATAAAQDAELDVAVVRRTGHVGAGQEHVAAVNKDGLGVELGVWRLPLVNRPLVDAVGRVGEGSPAAVEQLGRLQDHADVNASTDCRFEGGDDRSDPVRGEAHHGHPLGCAVDELAHDLRGEANRCGRRVRTGDDDRY